MLRWEVCSDHAVGHSFTLPHSSIHGKEFLTLTSFANGGVSLEYSLGTGVVG